MGTTTNYGWEYDDATDDVNTFPTRLANLAQDIDTDLKNGLAAKSDLASPTFTGTPAAPTAAVGTNTTQIATTAFVLANAPASGLTLISKTDISAATSTSFNNVFSPTYDNYLILLAPATQSASVMAYIRLRASGADTTTGYSNAGWYQSAGGSVTANPDANDAMYCFQTGTYSGSAVIWMMSPNLAKPTLMQSHRQRVGEQSSHTASQSGSTQFDGFTIYMGSGNLTATVRIYGIKNS